MNLLIFFGLISLIKFCGYMENELPLNFRYCDRGDTA